MLNADAMYPSSWNLAQDNGPCHQGEAKSIIASLPRKPLHWPHRSPDLNPIKTFGFSKRKLSKEDYSI